MRPGGDWSLRLARVEDAAAMPAIERAAAELFTHGAGLEGFDPDDTWEVPDLQRLIRKGHSLVAHVGEAMAGFLLAQPFSRELHIWEMDVLPAFGRRGIGSGLIRAAQIDARTRAFSSAHRPAVQCERDFPAARRGARLGGCPRRRVRFSTLSRDPINGQWCYPCSPGTGAGGAPGPCA